ncbi:hypothetical protein BN8_01932 [Fibrisoma limi BUZ 3]|uniref:Intracellular proteinase inhibitor BsuPI domain-containing protein n=1 Tax=Fibrisoma limi BUZ 3 TaxID=1185876 RepID=I2GG68_9BACT|nr:hypothetical protein [Fibrisoma limi]CCH52893.1 hypothetical protein BN8_01932 [Fibrisoma limi BUZ 3]
MNQFSTCFTTGLHYLSLVLGWLLLLAKPVASVHAQAADTEGFVAVNTELPARTNPDYAPKAAVPLVLLDQSDLHISLYPDKNPLRLKLLIGNRTGYKLTMRLETNQHESLYFEKLGADWAWRLLNMEDMPEGRYTLKVQAGPHRVIREFVIGTPRPVGPPLGPKILF